MRMYTAHTEEVDDPQAALNEILAQLPYNIEELAQEKRLVGILSTHVDAIHEGVVEMLCKALPFEIVGMTSFASATQKGFGWEMLNLVILESDNVRFAAVISEPLEGEDYKECIARAYDKAKEALEEEASLIVAYAPFIKSLGGQDMISGLTQASGDAPIIGALASDHTRDATESFVVYNGEAHPSSMALLCMAGPVNARFYFASLQDAGIKNKRATITASDFCTVSQVNDVPVMQYLSTLGFSAKDWEGASLAIPFLVDYKDGAPNVARELLRVTPEGHMVFGGEMPEGAYMNLALQTSEEIIRSTKAVLQTIAEERPANAAILMVGCVGRAMILGTKPLGEAQLLTEILGGEQPMFLLYARGEMCPTYAMPKVGVEKRVNRFHNFSFTACVLSE